MDKGGPHQSLERFKLTEPTAQGLSEIPKGRFFGLFSASGSYCPRLE
jgi:hypothetical protein